jgi:hypothetical protein
LRDEVRQKIVGLSCDTSAKSRWLSLKRNRLKCFDGSMAETLAYVLHWEGMDDHS